MNNARYYILRKRLAELYNEMSEEDKTLLLMILNQDREHEDIISALRSQDKKLDDIRRGQSWWNDFSANIAANAAFDGAVWVGGKILRSIK